MAIDLSIAILSLLYHFLFPYFFSSLYIGLFSFLPTSSSSIFHSFSPPLPCLPSFSCWVSLHWVFIVVFHPYLNDPAFTYSYICINICNIAQEYQWQSRSHGIFSDTYHDTQPIANNKEKTTTKSKDNITSPNFSITGRLNKTCAASAGRLARLRGHESADEKRYTKSRTWRT